jgi:MiaB/RimO family radical SAM methylthiotransferase
MKKKKVFIFTSGCERRLLDAERIKNYFEKNDWKVVRDPRKADIIFYNSCAVNKSVEDLSIDNIERFKKLKAQLIVAGCLPKINQQRLKKHFQGITFFPESLDKIGKTFPKHKIRFNQIPDANKFYEQGLYTEERVWSPNSHELLLNRLRKRHGKFIFNKLRQRICKNKNKEIFHLRISNGCLGSCSYCGIKKAVGKLRSKPLKKCLQEFNRGLKLGYKKYAIQADDVGAYGLDIGLTFPHLMNKILSKKENLEIYIPNLHPKWVVKYKKEMLGILLSSKIKKFECPIQSGSDRILKLMNRYPPPVLEIKKLLKEIKNKNPKIKIRTNIIVGFPSETKRDFQETLNFIKEIEFSELCLFKLLLVPGTLAEKMEPKVSEKEKEKRLRIIKDFAKSNRIRTIEEAEDTFDF